MSGVEGCDDDSCLTVGTSAHEQCLQRLNQWQAAIKGGRFIPVRSNHRLLDMTKLVRSVLKSIEGMDRKGKMRIESSERGTADLSADILRKNDSINY